VAVCLYELAAGCGRAASSGEVSGEARSGAKAHDNSAGVMCGLKPVPSTEPVPFTETEPFTETNDPAAASGRLELLAGVVEETMRAAGYSPRTMQAANRHDLRLLLRRLGLPERDLRRILGLFRHILWRLRHAPEGGRKAD
jgi:hypothetical protein